MILGQTNKKRPFINLPLKGDTNDKSLNNHAVTNSGATSTTGQFGESNGAYDFDGVNNQLTIGSSVYDTLVDYINSGHVTIHFNMINNLITPNNDSILSLYDTSGNFSYFYGINEYKSGTGYHGLYAGGAGSNNNNIYSNAVPTVGSWKRMVYTHTYATTILTGGIFENGVALSLNRSQTNQLVLKSISVNRTISIGWRQDSPTNRSFKGKIHNFAIYTTKLSSGTIKLLNKQKGRIKA